MYTVLESWYAGTLFKYLIIGSCLIMNLFFCRFQLIIYGPSYQIIPFKKNSTYWFTEAYLSVVLFKITYLGYHLLTYRINNDFKGIFPTKIIIKIQNW